MISIEHVATMAAYNRWMNEKLYDCASRLSDAQRKADVAAFFKSIHGTLNHLLVGDRLWLGRFVGEPFAAKSLDQELYADFVTLRAERQATDVALEAWTAKLTPATLSGDLVYTTMAKPQERRTPLWFAVTHFFNHQTHHRGQLTALLMQQGIDPGVTDLLWLPGGPR